MALLKFSHVFFVMIWLSGLITLSGLLAYQKENNLELSRLFKKLYFSVELPCMVLAVLLGVTLLLIKGVSWKSPWLHLKLTFALGLIICDILVGNIVAHLNERNSRVGGAGRFLLHYAVLACLIMVLVAIYILK